MPKIYVISLFLVVSVKNSFLSDSENDLKINVFLAAMESEGDVDVRFKDPAQKQFP